MIGISSNDQRFRAQRSPLHGVSKTGQLQLLRQRSVEHHGTESVAAA
jgi:hypothetical protein